MIAPKYIRRWKYKRILKKLYKYPNSEKNVYLCHECRYRFPFLNIRSYPELYNNRRSAPWYPGEWFSNYHVWFRNNKQRINYVLDALHNLDKSK